MAADTPNTERLFYDLREYHFDSAPAAQNFAQSLTADGIGALKRIGFSKLGAFQPADHFSPIYVLLADPSLEALATADQRLLADVEVAERTVRGAADGYRERVSSLLHAFEGVPNLETPTSAPHRVLQLRVYEHPSVLAGQKKLEMFHRGELDIFQRVGLQRVFFGVALSGPRLPNLTYLLAFDNVDQQQTAWRRFLADPAWQELRAIAEYADDLLIRSITNIELRPLPGSDL